MTDDATQAEAPALPVGAATPSRPPTEPPAPPPPPTPRRRWRRVAIALGGMVAVLAVSGLFVRLPYVIISPGDAIPVNRAMKISGARTFPHRGSLVFLTVAVSNERPNVYAYIAAELDPNASIVDEQDVLQGQSRQKEQELDTALMDESQQVAKKVALEKLGYTVPVHGNGAIVARIVEKSPAASVLRVGDVITAVDGTPVTLVEQLGPMVRARKPGMSVALTVERRGRIMTLPIVTAPAPAGDRRGQAYIGVEGATKDQRYDFPVGVTIDSGGVTGPSAGLAFALTVIDELTPGDLTGGRRVAVTGEIRSDGSVGEVGGIEQKAVTARQHGAALFIVPEAEAKAARQSAGKVRVVGVKDLDGALAALREEGGDPLPVAPARAG
jgi:Lon-like protease